MLQHKSIRRFVVLSGVRRVGKNVESVLAIYEMLYPIEGTRYIFFDEIHFLYFLGKAEAEGQNGKI